MTISLGQCNDDVKKIYKTPSLGNNRECKLKDNTSVVTPTIIMNLSVGTLSKYNYAYIPDFGRYYYITDITSLTSNTTELKMKCDVLYTYKDEIKNCVGFCTRNTNEFEPYLTDTVLPVSTIRSYDYVYFDGVDIGRLDKVQATYVMITQGSEEQEGT